MNPNYLKNAPAESDGVAYESGWITKENFVKYLNHFVKYVHPSESFPVLLIIDNHGSHVSLEAINFCRDHHITMLGIPPHTSGHLQPLDVGVYAPLKVVYSSACNSFLTGNPGKMIRIDDIAGVFKNAYKKIATAENAIKGFKGTGIQPFNPNIFSDSDFKAALVTERPDPTQPTEQSPNSSSNSLDVSSIVADNSSPTTHAINTPSTSAEILQPSATEPVSTLNTTFTIENAPEVTNECLTTPSPLPAMPHAVRPTPKYQRKKLSSLILSSTPVKNQLEEKENLKAEKLAK